MAGPAQQGSHDQDPHPGAGSSHPGADLRDLVPLIQGTADSVRRIRAIVEQDSAVVGADELRYVSPLGQGGFGVVFKCRYTPAPGNMRASLEKLTGRPAADGSFTVAVKKLKGAAETRLGMEAAHAAANGTPGEDLAAKAAREHAEAVAEFAHEVLMLKKLAHPNVIGYVGCAVFQGARAPGGADGDDEDGDEQLALVLEYAQYGSLKDMIARSSRGLAHAYQLAEGLQWCHDIARGMDYLHHCTPPIMHRDLKPGNVMLCAVDGRRVAKVADFGLAALCLERRKIVARQATIALSRAGDGQRSRVYKQFNTTGGVGSLHYMARARPRAAQARRTRHADAREADRRRIHARSVLACRASPFVTRASPPPPRAGPGELQRRAVWRPRRSVFIWCAPPPDA